MNLSKNFTLEEFTVTGTKISNIPTDIEIQRLTELVKNVLQPLRDLNCKPIKVTSGFRSAAVNKAVGGATDSQHCLGEGADIESVDNAILFHLIRQNLPYDQLIWEGGNDIQPAWVHVSYKANRKQTLKMKTVDGKKKYEII